MSVCVCVCVYLCVRIFKHIYVTRHDEIRRKSRELIVHKSRKTITQSFLVNFCFFTYLVSLIIYLTVPKIWATYINSKYPKIKF